MLNNPQFALSLPEPGTHEVDNKTLSEPWKISLVQVSIALMQKGRRQLRDESGGKDPWLPIGVGLFHVSLLLDSMDSREIERALSHFFQVNRRLRRPLTKASELRLVGGLNFSYSRTITLQTKLPAGHYLILVSTYNPGTVGEFFLRIASPQNANVTVREL